MAQGTIKMTGKPKPAKAVHSKRQASKVSKSGTTKAQKVDKVHKKFTAGLTGRTEALLGERAGHLELIGLGKKSKKASIKGGTKKFG
ncbi:hypothetical protein VHEMI02561 [[Torrubiella] hemipterigena]|uniref:Uncharacterized protein n=1 Tax=[Torrubiella] hemipterigena TaxID=1531966 RepID=A0A0A1SW48_9HYPO|nr:hypothetical protein VHEMI02561 [[Torrubiella] hemipterigena]